MARGFFSNMHLFTCSNLKKSTFHIIPSCFFSHNAVLRLSQSGIPLMNGLAPASPPHFSMLFFTDLCILWASMTRGWPIYRHHIYIQIDIHILYHAVLKIWWAEALSICTFSRFVVSQGFGGEGAGFLIVIQWCGVHLWRLSICSEKLLKPKPGLLRSLKTDHWYDQNDCLVGGLEHDYDFPTYWEVHHPNWLTHIFQRGGLTTNQWTIDSP